MFNDIMQKYLSLYLYLELAARIHGEPVENHLAEGIMIEIYMDERFHRTITEALTEEVVHGDIAFVGEQHIKRYHAAHQEIDHVQRCQLEEHDEALLHPFHSAGFTRPLFMTDILQSASAYLSPTLLSI